MKSYRKKSKYLFSIIAFVYTIGVIAQDVKGTWKGELEVQGMKLEMSFNINEENGKYTSTFDVPLQGVVGFPLEKTSFVDNTLTIESAKLKLKYVGTLEEKNLNGIYSQLGQDYPFNLVKTVKIKPGDLSLPSSKETLEKIAALETETYKYSVEDFFMKPKLSIFRISPDGNYISYRKIDEKGKNNVIVKNLSTGKEAVAIYEKEDLVRTYFWKGNNRLIYLQDKGGDENYHLFGANPDGTNNIELTPFDKTMVQLSNVLKDDPNHMIIQMNKDNKQLFEPYKIDINSGEIKKLFENKDPNTPIAGYTFDNSGVLREYSKLKEGKYIENFYKNLETNEFELRNQTDFETNDGILAFDYTTEYPHDAYLISNLTSDKYEVYTYDLKEKKILKTIFKDDTYAIKNIVISSKRRNFEIDFYSYEGAKETVVPVSALYKKIYKKLHKKFGEKEISVLSYNDEETKFIVHVSSDKLRGIYYLYNLPNDSFEELGNMLPHLNESDMAAMKPISFTSRDGKTIHGYITLPKEALNNQKVPLILNPHGGPFGVRDSWGYVEEVQLFASRGYATLQVNYRGSGGYGKAFQKAGDKQVGRAMIDDLEDGVKYAISQGWIDEDKVAVYGASYGGLATLQSLIKTPEMYICGVDYVGVSNLFSQLENFTGIRKSYIQWYKDRYYDPENPEEHKIMTAVSPALNADKISQPLLVIQGANDPRVKIEQADQIVKNMRDRGIDVPYMVKYNEGHGFGHEENKIELYKTMLGFFAQHLK
ncbi:alpha/beta hydrolase family protein [Aquimarina rubra]|uniref:Alpha/beta hydrolase family protein n=1 Tax=Aquimarina rubra TaxID=1920033 RepID=A0ABW5LPX9_9FLAO